MRFKQLTKAQEAKMKLSNQRMLKDIENRIKRSGGRKFSMTNRTCSDCGEKYNVYNYHIWKQTPCLCEGKKPLFVQEE
mgnify:CR=1 FL=1